jgi:hypothetical protein
MLGSRLLVTGTLLTLGITCPADLDAQVDCMALA